MFPTAPQAPQEGLHLPEINPYIPENLELKPLKEGSPETPYVLYEATEPTVKACPSTA